MPAVGYACVPLPSANNGTIPELVRMPAFPQTTGRTIDRERMVPRWRLAREGPFLEERSADSIRSLGPGCAFRNTTYRASDYAEPAGEYGLLLKSSAVPGVDKGSTIRRITRTQRKAVGGSTFEG